MYISFFHNEIEIILIIFKKFDALVLIFFKNILNSINYNFMFFEIQIINVDIILFHPQVYFIEYRIRNVIFDFAFYKLTQKHLLLLVAAELWKYVTRAIIRRSILYLFYESVQKISPVWLYFAKFFLFFLFLIKYTWG